MNTSITNQSEDNSQRQHQDLKQRTRCEVWTRVMGYHRPVQNFNIGKKAEHYSRKHFSETVTANQSFAKQFAA